MPGVECKEIPGKFTGEVPKGATIVLETAGGGGFGHPFHRNPAAVRQDVVNGLVSKTAALEDYGVILDETLQVD